MTITNTHLPAAPRGRILKTLVFGLLAAALFPLLHVATAKAASPEKGKTLVVYYSRTGNTRHIADYIQSAIQADIVELKTAVPYPEDYRDATRQAREELEAGRLPPLDTVIDNLADYDTVIIGSPIWWGTVAMPVRTFLSEYDLSGKTVALFVTHGGSGIANSLKDVKESCPESTVPEALAIRSSNISSARNEVTGWLNSIGLGR